MSDLTIKWKDSPLYPLNADALHQIHPMENAAQEPFMAAHSQTELVIYAHTALKIINTNVHKVFQVGNADLEFTIASKLDTGAIAAGLDYYVYVCDDVNDTASIKISLNSSYPAGYTAQTSRKIGGFHTLCIAVGTIAGHSLTDFAVKAVLPASVWCLNHRPRCNPEGMVYSTQAKLWVDIYLQSGTGGTTASVYNATVTDTRDWMDFNDDLAAVGKRLLGDDEFQAIAAGSNEETNIFGSGDPVTTGGHVDTASVRMVSHLGVEDACGAFLQWLRTPSAKLDNSTTAGWINLAGAKGSFYTYGTNGYGNTQLLAGGVWNDGASCGSRCRYAIGYGWLTGANFGARGCAEPR